MKLLISRKLPDAVMAEAEAAFDVTLRIAGERMSEAECIAALQEYDILLPTLGDALTKAVFDASPTPRCKMIANFGVGYNHIDVAGAAARGIAVTNTPGAVTDATADIGLMLILMTARRAGSGERMVRAGEWGGWKPVQLLGRHVSGKKLGIVGMGRIGQAVAHRGHYGFGMEIAYHSRSAKNLPYPARQLELHQLMAESDFVVIAAPANAETHHMINAEALDAMNPDGVLINIARGDLVDEAALIDALQNGKIAGAGLDVYENEPDVPAELIAMDHVTLLPHLGTAALEVREDMGRMALANAQAYADGRALPNPV